MAEISCKEVFRKYRDDTRYKANLELYDKVEQQENFFIGRQWEGLNAPDLEKPVINVVKRVTNYLISVLLVNDVGISFREALPGSGNANTVPVAESMWQEMARKELEKVQENIKFREKMRHVLRNAAVAGDAAVYTRFETEEDGANPDTVTGHIETEIIDSLNVHFGDKQTPDVQKQPWIIISKTELTKTLKEQYPDVAEEIRSDCGGDFISDTKSRIDDKMTTVCIYFWRDKETKTVWYMMCTEDCVLVEATDTKLKRYPVSWMNWERVKDSYHGIGVVEEIIPNQIAVNKLWAMSLIYAKDMAFPKIIYDKSRLEKWTNKVGAAIAVNGNVNDAIATPFRPSSLPEAVLTLVGQTVSYTKEFMGANDAALGNVNPENTSAIIALQKSSAAPLELQRLAFYQFIEDLVRTIYEIMRVKFGQRYIITDGQVPDPVTGQAKPGKVAQLVDFSQMPADRELIVDIGASDYWSEITQTNTMDNLFRRGILKDAVAYVESVPDKNIRNKQEVLEAIKAEQRRQRHLEEVRAINNKNMA